jgi:hypothetical protein
MQFKPMQPHQQPSAEDEDKLIAYFEKRNADAQQRGEPLVTLTPKGQSELLEKIRVNGKG